MSAVFEASTAQALGVVGRLVHGAPLVESAGADFKRGTWSFKVSPAVQVSAGQFVVLPAEMVRKALAEEVKPLEGGAELLMPLTRGFSSFYDVGGDQALEISSAWGSAGEIALYKRYPKSDERKTFTDNPAHWRGMEFRTDNHGRRWHSSSPSYVMDDFGDLVAVPEEAS